MIVAKEPPRIDPQDVNFLNQGEQLRVEKEAERMALCVDCAMTICEKLELDMDEHMEAIYSLIYEAVKD